MLEKQTRCRKPYINFLDLLAISNSYCWHYICKSKKQVVFFGGDGIMAMSDFTVTAIIVTNVLLGLVTLGVVLACVCLSLIKVRKDKPIG